VPEEWTRPSPVLYLVRYSYRSVFKTKRYVTGTDSVPVPGIKVGLMTELIGPIQVVVKLTVGKRTEIDSVPETQRFTFNMGRYAEPRKLPK